MMRTLRYEQILFPQKKKKQGLSKILEGLHIPYSDVIRLLSADVSWPSFKALMSLFSPLLC